MNKEPLQPRSFGDTFRDGFFLILPLGVTLTIFQWLWKTVFSFLPEISTVLPVGWQSFPYFKFLVDISFIFIFVFIVLFAGIIASTFFGRYFYKIFDAILSSSPFIKPIYNAIKKMSAMLFTTPETGISEKLTEAVMVPYPDIGDWSVAYVTSYNADHFFGPEKGKEYLTVYMPSSPIVSSGYYLTFKKADVRPCKQTATQVMGLLLSVGSLQNPESSASKKIQAALIDHTPKKRHLLRKFFLNGLLFLMPALGTVSLLAWIFNKFIYYVHIIRVMIPVHLRDIIPPQYFNIIANSVIILLFILTIFLLGAVGRSAVGKAFHQVFLAVAKKIPVFNTVYDATSTITDIFNKGSSENAYFSKAVLTHFPTEKSLAIGFVTHKDSAHLLEDGKDYVPVFLPTSPIPTTGWIMCLKKDKFTVLDMPVEAAIALVISVGISVNDK